MNTKATIAVIVTSTYLILYCFFLQVEQLQQLGVGMFALSPILLGWMVYSVLKYGRYTGGGLGADEESGYEDWPAR